MTTAVMVLATSGIFPCGGIGCGGIGCQHEHRYPCPVAIMHSKKEKFLGSWYLPPDVTGTCCDRFTHPPMPHQGYYYYRPYNYRHIQQYAQDGAAMGEDPQMPFAGEVFRARYRQKPEAAPDSNMEPEPLPLEPKPVRIRTNSTPNNNQVPLAPKLY